MTEIELKFMKRFSGKNFYMKFISQIHFSEACCITCLLISTNFGELDCNKSRSTFGKSLWKFDRLQFVGKEVD